MAIQKTFGIIKPDAVRKNVCGKIISMVEAKGLTVRGIKKLALNADIAEIFYAVHKEKPFFKPLVAFMCSGPVYVMVLEGEDAIISWRTIMGATDPAKAADGTIRKLYGANVQENAVHGSDAPETAAQEISFFFSGLDLIN
jgi:nucleoside-diphosphate kinase